MEVISGGNDCPICGGRDPEISVRNFQSTFFLHVYCPAEGKAGEIMLSRDFSRGLKNCEQVVGVAGAKHNNDCPICGGKDPVLSTENSGGSFLLRIQCPKVGKVWEERISRDFSGGMWELGGVVACTRATSKEERKEELAECPNL